MRAFVEELLTVQLDRREVNVLNDLFKHLSDEDILNNEEDELISKILEEFYGFLDN